MVVGDDKSKVRAEWGRAIGLFRYQLIREAAGSARSPKCRGKLVREIAPRAHTDPFGRRIWVSRQALDRWIRVGAQVVSTHWCPVRASASRAPQQRCWRWRWCWA